MKASGRVCGALAVVGAMALACGGGGGGGGDGGLTKTCTVNATIPVGEYIVENNSWNNTEAALPAHPIPSSAFTQCAAAKAGTGAGTVNVAWAWAWPVVTSVDEFVTRATPSIIYGFKPWNPRSTTSKLPALVANVGSLTVDASPVILEVGDHLTAEYDVISYLTSSDHKAAGQDVLPIEKSIMLVWNLQGFTTLPPDVSNIAIGGVAWDLYEGSSNLTYVLHTGLYTPPTSLHVDMADFLADALDRGLIEPTLYVASIETAAILYEGMGALELDGYEVQFQAGTPVVHPTLTVARAGSGGTVTSSPAGIDCGATCSASFAAGTSVTLTAVAASGSEFAGWGGACSGTGACVVTMNAGRSVTATFAPIVPPDHDRPATSARRIVYTAGPDGQYGTADDGIVGYNQVVYQADGEPLRDAWYFGQGAIGADGTWFTADDVPQGWFHQVGTSYGYDLSGPGADGTWFTDDDTILKWESFGTPSGGIATNVLHSGPGADGVWFDGDDVVSGYYLLTLNENGAEVLRLTFVDPGADGTWFTDDDLLSTAGYVVNTYPGQNKRWASWDRQVSYVSPGPDGKWVTDDDVIGSYRTHTFDDDSEYWTTETTWDAGPDGVWFTADDRKIGFARGFNTY